MNGNDDASEVVLTGLSARLPESSCIEEFAQQLFGGVDLVTADDRRWTPGRYGLPERSGKLKDLHKFDAGFFGVHAKQAHRMDPQLRLLLEVAHETIVDAGLSPAELRGSRTGVYVGVCDSEAANIWCADMDKITGYEVTGCSHAMFANRLSYTFDFKGPSLAIDSGCSSSLYALAHASDAIRNGHCDAAVVASTQLCLTPHAALAFKRLNMLSPDGKCAAFDAKSRGYVRSEAVIAVLLQRRGDARRVYCAVRGARVNNDGFKREGVTHPSDAAQGRLAGETFELARLRPRDVVYVEAHGTGTEVGDPEELNAIAELFCSDRRSPLLLGSVKSNMGHAEPACGLCGVAKVVLAMERGVIPGNLHYEEPNENIPALSDGRFKVVTENTPWRGGLVAVNSFGFGGANAHVILEGGTGQRPPPAASPAPPTPRLVLASGRTGDAVERLLRLAASEPRDAELHALLDAVHAHAISGHPYRGFAVLDPARDSAPLVDVTKSEIEPRPVWFVFGGAGSQWAGAARELLRLPAFAASIARSAAALAPHGVDLQYVIAEAPAAVFENVINTFVSITAVQVALVDVLRELGVRPDGIVGSSCGEIGCAYADETLTTEQAALCAYWRGRCLLAARPAPGAMAAVGMSWEDAQRLCPPDVECASYTAANLISVSGPPASIDKLIADLTAEGVFTRRIETSGLAFHSKYVAPAAPPLHAQLAKIIPEPKPRSARWLSSSVPQDQWGSDLVSPVQFASVLAQIPKNALVVELAPHAQMQAALASALPDAVHVPLLRREAPDALVHLLSAVGKAYVAGLQPQVSRLYPAVSWPVSRGTPSLASHVGWDHAADWSVPDCRTDGPGGETTVEFDLGDPDDAFISGHDIDGEILFPAAGYIRLLWSMMATAHNVKMEEAAVVVENMQILRAAVVSRDAPVQFLVSILSSSGEFEICEGGDVVVKGSVRLTDDPAAERVPATTLDSDEGNQGKEDLLPLDSDDIYKIFRLRGYNYEGAFRGIRSSDARITGGMIDWVENWVLFVDAMIQFICLGREKRGLYLPTFIQRVVIDPIAQRAAATQAGGGPLPVKMHHDVDIAVAGGVEIYGTKFAPVPRRVDALAAPKLEKYVFIPFDRRCANAAEERHALAAALALVVENCSVFKIQLAELAQARPATELLLPRAKKVLDAESRVHVAATLAAGPDAAQYTEAMGALGIQVSNVDISSLGFRTDWHVILAADVLTRRPGWLRALAAAAGFVLLDEPAGSLRRPGARPPLEEAGLILVSRALVTSRELLLLRRAATVPETKIVVEVRDDDYAWVEDLKRAMQRAEAEDLRVYAWSREQGSGILGMGTCLRLEPGGDRLRVYYLPGAGPFDPDAPAFEKQLRLDLVLNVLRAGVWGTFRHQLLDDVHEAKLQVMAQVEHAYVTSLTRGDLSSLRWVESDLCHASAAAQRGQRARGDLCRVCYAPLNLRDVMLAAGQSTPALPGDLADQECALGLEFSGLSSTGRRVMGMVPAKGLATTVLADESFVWEVPEHWSLEEAATVPVAYATAYYALVVRGRMRRGESVLVHAGAGDVGQAAIAVALHAGCAVFTTAGTPIKRAFLLERFPQLLNAHIGNSRDCSFEPLVRRATRGRGVDLVLNSLAGDKLQASLRCLAEGGRFLEIGELDLSANAALGTAVPPRNSTVHGILLGALLDARGDRPERATVAKCVTEGIASGAVRPLPATVYADDQLEQAFRYMAAGEHIGKVLIRVCEEVEGKPTPTRLMPAIPVAYMHPDKSYVIVGGLGGIGLELGSWLVSRGARTLVLNSRSGVRTGYQARCIRRWREAGVHVVVSTADASTAAGARALLRAAAGAGAGEGEGAAAGGVAGVFNLAGVMQDALLENQSPESFRTIARPKVNVTRELDAASRELAPELEHFVVFSSVAAGRGEKGSNAYGLANSAAERACERRRGAGLPALAVQWGAVADVGMLPARRGPGDRRDVSGTRPQRVDSCLETLGVLMTLPYAVAAAMVVADKRRARDRSPRSVLRDVADILGITDPAAVLETATLAELGVDSLLTSATQRMLERGHDVFLSAGEVRALTFRALRLLDNAVEY